ncbi:MAG TPA: head GIN domain-containing protein [Steroidobacteraceae bacterium]|jgi:hypothetical protein
MRYNMTGSCYGNSGSARQAMRSVALAAVAATTLLLSACHEYEAPTGPLRSETRQLGSFDSVEVEGSTRMQITVGVPESLVIEGRDPFIGRIKTEVRDHTLHIKGSHQGWEWGNGQSRVTVKIAVPRLSSLELQGGNEVRIAGYNGGNAKIEIQGAADIEATGRVDELSVSMSGAGNADLSKLIANNATVRVSGVGSIYVHPKDTLDATMNGVGAIFYTGKPREVNTRMNGLGTISQRDPKAKDASQEKDDTDSAQPEQEKPGTPKPDPSKVQSTIT